MTEAAKKRIRTCVGCGKQSDKVELMRIVRTEDGVEFDPTGRKPGRGAYVCSKECLVKAYTARKLQRALRCGLEGFQVDQAVADMSKSASAR